ncbi:MAG: 4Fe-4S dicluster domain-containing protein [Acidobacteriota bacterium]|nr:MAG: 4Fe-4S dicluster domain-containing protein [Acidobacteriota bacterium]
MSTASAATTIPKDLKRSGPQSEALMNRRKFLKQSCALLSGTAGTLSLPVLNSCQTSRVSASQDLPNPRWGMVVDVRKCREGCTVCTDACRQENNVAFHGDKRWDVHWIRKVKLTNPEDQVEKALPLLCNHCDNPPCAQVCPVQATYKRRDGIVIIDHHRCIGCRYCMIACPYNARYFNFKENPEWPNHKYPKRSHGVAESCNFCAHRVERGQLPACVEACGRMKVNALVFGDLNDPESEPVKLIAENPVKRIREDFGTEPKVYYIGL